MESYLNQSNLSGQSSILTIENFSNDISLSKENKDIIQSLLNYTNQSYYFICKKCKMIPLLRFQDLSKIVVSCKCSDNLQLTIDELRENYIIDDEEYDNIQEIESNLKCIEHGNNYKYYCLNDNKNLCEDCQKEHNCEKIYNFEKEKFILVDNIIPYIAKSLMNGDFKNLNDSFDNKILKTLNSERLKVLISILFNYYFNNPNYNTIVNIKNFYIKLKNIDDSEKEKYEIQNIIEIKSQTQYKKVNYYQKKYIKKIEINFNNSFLNDLENEILINLIELNLSCNLINNIEPLLSAEFKNLQILNLSQNRLLDNMIQVISKLNFKNLLFLDLSYNCFTQFKLFKSIEHFKNLQLIKFRSNRFTEDIDDIMKDKSIEYNLKSLRQMYLSNGVFTNKSIKIISKFILENLEILDLTSSKLTSLSFIDDLKYVKKNYGGNYQIIKDIAEYPLKKLLLNNNEISDISKLFNLKNLEEVEIKDNSIIINQSLNSLVKKMSSLKRINLIRNKVEP